LKPAQGLKNLIKPLKYNGYFAIIHALVCLAK